MQEAIFNITGALSHWHKILMEMGPRFTGNRVHNEFIGLIKKEIQAAGCEVLTDSMTFKRWEATGWGVEIISGAQAEPLPGIFYFPYSGNTLPQGIEGGLVYCGHGDFSRARGKIAIVDASCPELSSGLALHPRSAFRPGDIFPESLQHPVAGATLVFSSLRHAARAGVLGVIYVWSDLPDSLTCGQYLPFTTPLANCPALWAGRSTGNILKKHAAAGGRARFTLNAAVEHNATTEHIYTVLPGYDPEETVLVTTHTDGPNECEENGALGLLALCRYFAASPVKLRRSLVFVFVTGHFQLPQFAAGRKQATSRWLQEHPEFWDGKPGHGKAVAGITLEHLGAREWRVHGDKFLPSGNTEPEYVYTGNAVLDKLYLQSLSDRPDARGFTLRPPRFLYFGEGSSLYQAGIPAISLVPMPLYLCASVHRSESYVDIELMQEQVLTFIKLIERLDKMDIKDIGVNDRPVMPDLRAVLSAMSAIRKSKKM